RSRLSDQRYHLFGLFAMRAVIHDNLGTAAAKCQRRFPADAQASTRDEDDAVAKIQRLHRRWFGSLTTQEHGQWRDSSRMLPAALVRLKERKRSQRMLDADSTIGTKFLVPSA